MIRFVDLRSSGIEGGRFAFYDTIPNRFVTIGGDQAWEAWPEFENECGHAGVDPAAMERYRGLRPVWLRVDHIVGPVCEKAVPVCGCESFGVLCLACSWYYRNGQASDAWLARFHDAAGGPAVKLWNEGVDVDGPEPSGIGANAGQEIPVDLERCQVEIGRRSPLDFGRSTRARCSNAPVYVATGPGPADGSMSVCRRCASKLPPLAVIEDIAGFNPGDTA